MGKFFKNLTLGGKIVVILLLAGIIYGAKWIITDSGLIPRKISEAKKYDGSSVSIPTLSFDKDANAPFRNLPAGEEVAVESPEIHGEIMEWQSQLGMLYAIGGERTSKGSICEELGLNVKVTVQNNTGKQAEDLYAFAEGVHGGDNNPSKGATFIVWMGDGVPNYLNQLNKRLVSDFGEEYRAVVVGFAGASFGEDKWLLTPKYYRDPRGSLTVTVVRDGDWNICVWWATQNGIKVNPDLTTYDPDALNFVAAPNDDFIEASKFYVSGQKVKLRLVRNGKDTGKDTTLACSGVSTWFPGDLLAVKNKGNLLVKASTRDYAAQMPSAIIMIKKWADDNRKLVENFIEAVGKGGDQVKSHEQAVRFAIDVADVVFKNPEISKEDRYNAYKSYNITDDLGNDVSIGGSRVFNIADAAYYSGISGSADKYKAVFQTFGKIINNYYPNIVATVPEYSSMVDLSYLKAVYNKNKSNAGTVSKSEFKDDDRIVQTVSVTNYSIEFDFGSAEIRSSSNAVLEQVLNQLLVSDNLLVEIGGHTDNKGSSEVNMSVSQRRGESVKAWLVSKGLDASRLHVKGYGDTKPIADNGSDAGRSKNRRVEIKLGRN